MLSIFWEFSMSFPTIFQPVYWNKLLLSNSEIFHAENIWIFHSAHKGPNIWDVDFTIDSQDHTINTQFKELRNRLSRSQKVCLHFWNLSFYEVLTNTIK